MKSIKRILTISTALLTLSGGVQAQSDIDQVLRTIEQNNKSLQANAQMVASQKLEAKVGNNLPDPTLSYAHLWHSKEKDVTVGELVVSQSFDFPSLYVTRHQLNRLKSGSLDSQASLFRQELLLQAKELCLDIIQLRQQQQILQERLRNAEELSELYKQRLDNGDANRLENNKIRLELLNVRTEASLNETNLRSKLQQLQAFNGNIPVVFEATQYPAVSLPADFQTLQSEVMAADRNLQALNQQSQVARKQITVNKGQWLPKLELGYRRNTEAGTPLNGMVVGFSFPLFENRNQVKIAKAQALSADLEHQNASLQLASELSQLYGEASSLHRSMEEYRETFRTQQNMELLKQALKGGQISLIEYFVEVSVLYQSHQNYLQLENQYQKAMARIYKSRL